jgi:membrane protease YdiL (CAAX protease family)
MEHPVDSSGRRLRGGAAVLGILLVLDHIQELLSLVPLYRDLYKSFPFYLPEGGKSILQILLTIVALQLIAHESICAAAAELGFLSSPLRGLAFGFGAALVMLFGFLATLPFKNPSGVMGLLYLAGLSPLAEETVYRAFAVGTLESRCGAPRWLALMLPALVFGWGMSSRERVGRRSSVCLR